MPEPTVKFSYEDVPTIWRYSQDNTRQRLLMGPFGSGKSSGGGVMEIVKRAREQAPGRDGVRRTRWGVIRNSNRQLDDTTLATWNHWMERFGYYEKTPRNFILQMNAQDGSPVEAEVMFRPLDKPDDVDNLLSLELTGAWFNEVREIPKIIWDSMDGRVGRYPAADDGGCTWAGIFGDTNPPDTDHWIYYLFEEDRPRTCKKCVNPDGGPVLFVRDKPTDYACPQHCPVCFAPEEEGELRVAMYKQPSGRSPEAENLKNLPKGYYSNLMMGKDPGWVTVYVDGKYGYVRDGKPVYPNFSDPFHLAPKDMDPHRSYPLICGYDCTGRHQAFVICQWLPNSRFNILDEIYAEDTDVRTFLNDQVKPLLWAKYNGLGKRIIGDPAGIQKQSTDSSDAYREALANGIEMRQAYSNSWAARYGAVNRLLVGAPVDGKGKLQLNQRCKILHKGFLGAYRMRRMAISGQDRYEDKPVKNRESHLHDALQYAAMGTERSVDELEFRVAPTREYGGRINLSATI